MAAQQWRNGPRRRKNNGNLFAKRREKRGEKTGGYLQKRGAPPLQIIIIGNEGYFTACS